jgi:hypothetical protein
LAELIGQGRSHEDAVRLALEEFGDAAGLAAQFSYITQSRRRRLIMRCTVASVAALAAAVLVAMAMWPDQHGGPAINRAVAEVSDKKPAASENPFGGPLAAKPEEAKKTDLTARAIPLDLSEADRSARVDSILRKAIEKVDFSETPLSDVLSYLQDKYRIQIYVKRRQLRDAGIDPTTTPVTLALGDVQLRTVFDFIFDEIANGQLGYTVHDGVLVISTKSDLQTEVRVYNCRDLLLSQRQKAPQSPDHGGFEPSAAARLIGVIQTTIAPESWQGYVSAPGAGGVPAAPSGAPEIPLGGGTTGAGTIADFDGLLVVKNTPVVQEQVSSLLEKLSQQVDSSTLK